MRRFCLHRRCGTSDVQLIDPATARTPSAGSTRSRSRDDTLLTVTDLAPGLRAGKTIALRRDDIGEMFVSVRTSYSGREGIETTETESSP